MMSLESSRKIASILYDRGSMRASYFSLIAAVVIAFALAVLAVFALIILSHFLGLGAVEAALAIVVGSGICAGALKATGGHIAR